MNLQQLRYVVATADEGTMTRAAARLHVAQPALSRGVRGLEAEIDVAVFERDGRGVRVTRAGREVVALARRVLTDVDRIANLGEPAGLRVCAVTAQAREIGAAATAGFIASGRGRVSLDVEDRSAAVVDKVRRGRADLGIVDLPAPPGLHAILLGWQEIVLLHPPDWSLPDPVETDDLADMSFLSPQGDGWRRDRLVGGLRSAGIEPTIAAETNHPDLMISLVQQGAGAWFSYGRQAAAAVAGGAGMVHISPPPVRQVGIISSDTPAGAAAAFVDIARDEAAEILLAVDDPRLAEATWVTDAGTLGPVPQTTILSDGTPPG